METSSYVRTMAVGTLLAVAVFGMQILPAYAAKKTPDNMIRCALQDEETGEWNFYLPGETTTSTLNKGTSYENTITFVCGKDGHWQVVRTAQPQRITPAGSGTSTLAP